MPNLTVSAVRKQIASGRADALYLILGDDEVEKVALAAEFAETIEAELRVFNVDRFYGGDATAGDVVSAARTLPMMAPRRIVIVLRAERLLIPKRETEAAARDLETLEEYIKAPDPAATLVLAATGLDRRRRLVATLLRQATVVDCGGLQDMSDAVRWVRAKLSEARVQADADAVRLLAERAGPNVVRLRGDVDRVLLYTLGRTVITAADVHDVVGAAVGQDDWAAARAIEQGDAATALRELALALEAGAVPYMVLGQLGWLARTKVPASRAEAAIEAVFRTDLALKRSGGDPRVLLERLIVELCVAAGRTKGGARATR